MKKYALLKKLLSVLITCSIFTCLFVRLTIGVWVSIQLPTTQSNTRKDIHHIAHFVSLTLGDFFIIVVNPLPSILYFSIDFLEGVEGGRGVGGERERTSM